MVFRSSPSTSQSGFTLIELVVVIVLLAIISVYASSRFIGVKSFSGYAAQDQAMAVIRQVQLGRMQSNVADINDPSCSVCNHYKLMVSASCLGSVAACNDTSGSLSDKVELDDTNLSFSPPSYIQFDLLGKPSVCNASGTICSPVTSTTSISISDSGGEAFSVCLNSQGYIAEENGCG